MAGRDLLVGGAASFFVVADRMVGMVVDKVEGEGYSDDMFAGGSEVEMYDDENNGRPDTSLSKTNRLLINGYGVYSAEQLSEQTGIPAGEIAKRQQALFDSIDVLDIAKRRAKLMLQLEAIGNDMAERIPNASDRNAKGLADSVRASVATVLKELREMEKADRVDIERVALRRSEQLVEIVDRAYYKQLGRLEERFGVSADDLEDEFKADLMAIAREYDERNV